jgi:hypothetical protein
MPKFLNNIDLNKNELQNAVVQVATDPPGSPKLGQIFFDSSAGINQLQICTDAAGPTWEGMVTETAEGSLQFNTALKIGRDSQNLIDFATTDNKIIFRVNDVDELELVENALQPTTTNGIALGTSSLMWSDLFLASGSVINFNAGDVTLTHSSNTLTVAGGTLATEALTTTTIATLGTVTVGVDGTGHDVKFYGATAGKYMEWDESADTLNIEGDLTVQGNVNLAQGDIVGGRSKNYATSIGWVPDAAPGANQTGYFGGDFVFAGAGAENSLAWSIDPFGGRSLVWNTHGSVDNDTDGGWNKDITIPADNNMGYLSYIYIRKNESTAGDTSPNTTGFYLGCRNNAASTLELDGSAATSGGGPYFASPGGSISYSNLEVGIWYCVVGIIQAYTDAATDSWDGGGVYRMDTGQKIGNSETFKMAEDATTQAHRALFYYSQQTAHSGSFWNPGFHARDGSEPKLNELLGRRIVGGLDTDIKVGRDAHNLIDFTTDDEITFRVGDADGVVMKASGEIEATSLDISGNVDVNGIIYASNASGTIGTSKIIMQNDGTLDWGNTQDYGVLTWVTDYALVRGQSGKGIKLGVNGNTDVLTIDTSQNATFTGTIDSGAITSTGQITGTEIEGTSLDINGVADITGAVTVGVDGTGHDVKFFGATTGMYMQWDASEDGLVIATPADEVGLGVYTTDAGTTPNFKVGRNVNEYFGIMQGDRECQIIHRQDETDSGAMFTSFELWDNGDGSGDSYWDWNWKDGAGANEVNKMRLTKAGKLWLRPDASVFAMGLGSDFTITHDGTTGATLAGNPVNITAGGASTWKATAGSIVIDSEAGAVLLDGHTGVAIASATGEIDITAGLSVDINANSVTVDSVTGVSIDAGDNSNITVGGTSKTLDIDATGALTIDSGTSISIGTNADKPVSIDSTTFALDASSTVAIDGTGISIDGTLDSNLTVAGSGKDLDINITGGGTQQLRLASSGTDGSALKLTASAGSVDINAGDNITMDAADLITLTTADTGADGKISLVSATTGSNTAIHLDGNADASAIVDIDAGVLDIDVTGAATLDAATSWTVNSPLTRFTSSTSAKPVVDIKNTTNDTSGAILKFTKDKAAAGADGDIIGQIDFDADDAAQTITTFGRIMSTIAEADDGAEAGRLELYVATSNGTTTGLDAGLILTGSASTADEVNVTIGKGTASVVTAAGDLVVTGDLTVGGTTTTVNSTTVDVADININLGNGIGNDAAVDTGGITLESTTSNKTWNWIDATDSWTSNQHIDIVSSGTDYKIAGTSVLSATVLGSSVVTSSLTTVGTIGSGTWQGNDVGVEHGGTGRSTLDSNAVLVGNGTGNITSSTNLSFDDTDLTIGGAGKMEFRDNALYINSSTDGQLDIVADTEIEITAPTVDFGSSILHAQNIIGNNPLRLHAGESYTFSSSGDTQVNEYIYLNAEQGLQINSSNTNWGDGLGLTIAQNWAARNTATICDNSGNSTFPGDITLTGELDAATGDFSGIIDVAGVATLASLVCTAGATFGGGYGNTGATISTAGIGTFNGALTTDGVLTGNSLVCTLGATFGGGYGSTGATISDAGVGQFNGALTSGGTITAATDFIASAVGLLTAPAADDMYFSGYGIMGNRSAAVYITNTDATGLVTIGNGAVHGSGASATFSASAISLLRATSVTGALSSDTSVTVGSTVVTDDSIVMTPSTNDTFTIASAANGATSLTTVDTNAAAAHITVVADGNFSATGVVSTITGSTSIELAGDTNIAGALDVTGALTAGDFSITRSKTFTLNDDEDSANNVSSNNNGAASTIFTITHGMGASRNYKVEVMQVSDYSTVFADVTRPSDTTIVVTFASNVALGAYKAMVTSC